MRLFKKNASFVSTTFWDFSLCFILKNPFHLIFARIPKLMTLHTTFSATLYQGRLTCRLTQSTYTKMNRILWLLLRCFAAVLITGSVTSSFPPKKHTALGGCCTPYWLAGSCASWITFCSSLPECLRVRDSRQAECLRGILPSMRSPVTNAIKPCLYGEAVLPLDALPVCTL